MDFSELMHNASAEQRFFSGIPRHSAVVVTESTGESFDQKTLDVEGRRLGCSAFESACSQCSRKFRTFMAVVQRRDPMIFSQSCELLVCLDAGTIYPPDPKHAVQT